MNRIRQIHVLWLALVCLALAGCPGSPVREAVAPELKAQALYAEYVIAEEAVARLMQSPQVPDDAKLALQAAHKAATPTVEAMEAQRLNLAKLRIQSPEGVPAALLALNDLILAATPLVNSFTARTK